MAHILSRPIFGEITNLDVDLAVGGGFLEIQGSKARSKPHRLISRISTPKRSLVHTVASLGKLCWKIASVNGDWVVVVVFKWKRGAKA